jgi:hypothetical protein
MRITKRQLRRIIKEEKARLKEMYLDDVGGDLGAHVVDYLKDQARSYHADPSLDIDGDGVPDATAIKTLLQDDFMDNFGHEFDLADFGYEISNFAHGAGLQESKKMKITMRQLRRIIKEEKARMHRLNEQENAPVDTREHQWPSADSETSAAAAKLSDLWNDMEVKSWSAGDPSMNDNGELSDAESKVWWSEQVESASAELESALEERLRAVSIETMQEFTDMLINGDFA